MSIGPLPRKFVRPCPITFAKDDLSFISLDYTIMAASSDSIINGNKETISMDAWRRYLTDDPNDRR